MCLFMRQISMEITTLCRARKVYFLTNGKYHFELVFFNGIFRDAVVAASLFLSSAKLNTFRCAGAAAAEHLGIQSHLYDLKDLVEIVGAPVCFIVPVSVNHSVWRREILYGCFNV